MTVADHEIWTTADRLDHLAVSRRFRIRAEADETEWLAALAADPDPYRDGSGVLDKSWIVEDVACTLRVASAVAAARLHVAHQLATRFTATFEALRDRRCDLRSATRLVEAAEALPDEVIAEFEGEVLARVDELTISQFCAKVRRAVSRFDARNAEAKRAAQLEQRRVVFTPVADGVTEVWGLLPAEGAAALQNTLQQLAADAKTADAANGCDDRTADQRRADALCELATGGVGVRPSVHVVVNASTLLGLDDEPGDLAGYGPITAAAVRAIAHDPTGTWRRLLTAAAGNLVDVSSRRYRPPAPMERFVELRDRTCRFPTCRRRAASCELDHVVPWLSGGKTAPWNLIPLCSRHHHLKHDGRWHVVRKPDGSVIWTSPTGRRWTTPPPDAPGG